MPKFTPTTAPSHSVSASAQTATGASETLRLSKFVTEKARVRWLRYFDCRGYDALRFLGSVEDNVLRNRYAAVDTLVFPLIRVKGDVERLGMEAIKPATSGAPTVAFPVRGLVDAVADNVSGSFVQEGDYSTFADAVASIYHDGPPHGASCRCTHLS